MAQSYTPGLKVVESTRVVKQRILPIKGQVMVNKGDRVAPDQVVARTELPGDVYPVHAANSLGITPKEVPAAMKVAEGSYVEEGDVLAQASSFFGLFKSTLKSPKSGTVENISNITGQVILRGKPIPVEVKAYIPGVVSEVREGEGVIVECEAAFIQGIFGIGGERLGKLQMLVETPSQILEENLISEEHKGLIVVGGAMATAAALRKAESLGVAGIIVGGFDDRDLRDYLGYDLGVAITGSEEIGISLIVTEGFGEIAMAEKTFDLFKRNDGKVVSINGATQIRAGVIRPETVIPADNQTPDQSEDEGREVGALLVGSTVRCIRNPYFGRIGTVVGLPHELTPLESETRVRVLEVDFGDGVAATVPRANVEIIEGS